MGYVRNLDFGFKTSDTGKYKLFSIFSLFSHYFTQNLLKNEKIEKSFVPYRNFVINTMVKIPLRPAYSVDIK